MYSVGMKHEICVPNIILEMFRLLEGKNFFVYAQKKYEFTFYARFDKNSRDMPVFLRPAVTGYPKKFSRV